MQCNLCPRACGVDRSQGQLGYCGVPSAIRLARAALHRWEEPCISGTTGSGAVFFSGCNMGCVYCQNREISQGARGIEVTPERLEEIAYELLEQGAANINLVTPDPYIPQLVQVLATLRRNNFPLPIVYNTSAYVRVESLRCLEGLVDIYLPDFKYMDAAVAEAYSDAPDYPQTAMAAIAEMVRQLRAQTQPGQPVCSFDAQGMMRRGVIVRHLLLPGQLYAARRIVKCLYGMYGDAIYISLMNQYTPMPDMQTEERALGERVSQESYENLVQYAGRLGVTQGFIQEGDTAQESFIPPFDGEGVWKENHKGGEWRRRHGRK